MSAICNSALSFQDAATEQLKNHEIEMGSTALCRGAAACMLLIAAVESHNEAALQPLITDIANHLDQAHTHYMRVLMLVEHAQIRPDYRTWLQSLDYADLWQEHVTAHYLPQAPAIWESVVAPVRDRGDGVESYRTAFLDRFAILQQYVGELDPLVTPPPATYEVSLMPKAVWKLQTLLTETMLAGQMIAAINALKPTDMAWVTAPAS